MEVIKVFLHGNMNMNQWISFATSTNYTCYFHSRVFNHKCIFFLDESRSQQLLPPLHKAYCILFTCCSIQEILCLNLPILLSQAFNLFLNFPLFIRICKACQRATEHKYTFVFCIHALAYFSYSPLRITNIQKEEKFENKLRLFFLSW